MAAYVGIFGSQAKTAKAAGISTTTLYRWLQGKAIPAPAYLRKLQRAAARLATSSDIPAGEEQTAAPASPYDDEGGYEDGYDEYEDESDYEPVQDRRPRGLYVVGGTQADYAPPGKAPARGEEGEAGAGGWEIPGFLKKARQLAEDIKPLSQKEAAALRESTIRAFQRFWKYGDEIITNTNQERAEAHIWSDIEREETELLVDALIERGMESAVAAQIVRGISHIWNYYAVGLILGPRFWKTFKFYASHGGIAL